MGAEKNVAEVLGAWDTGLKPPGRFADVVAVTADSPTLYGLIEAACVFGFRDAAGANLRAADHPVLLTIDGAATDPDSSLMIAEPASSVVRKGTPRSVGASGYREARLTKLSAKLSLLSRFHREEMICLLSLDG